MIIRADAGQVLNVRIITDASSGGAVMDGTRTALNIVKLPANAEILNLTDATGQNINATASLLYGTRSGDLPGIFSHDPSSNSNRIGVNAGGDICSSPPTTCPPVTPATNDASPTRVSGPEQNRTETVQNRTGRRNKTGFLRLAAAIDW